MLPSFRQLQFLVALADELHFGRAAEACHVTQSTLSTGLKELEAILGVSLAERTKRSVLMTPIGLELAARARALLLDARDFVDVAAREAGTLAGDLRLGAIPTLGPYLLPKALQQLRQRFPQLRLYLREELTDSLVAGLNAGRLDVILIALPYDIGDLVVEPLFEDGYQLAMPRGYGLADCQIVAAQQLVGEKLMLLERGHCLQQHALSALPEANAAQDERFAATSLSTLVSMVAEGLGITLLPQLAIDGGLAKGSDLVLTPLEDALPRRVVLAWRRTSARAEEFRQLAEVFVAARQSLAAG